MEEYQQFLSSLRVIEIKRFLKAHGVCDYGLRSVLINRLESLIKNKITNSKVRGKAEDESESYSHLPSVLDLKSTFTLKESYYRNYNCADDHNHNKRSRLFRSEYDSSSPCVSNGLNTYLNSNHNVYDDCVSYPETNSNAHTGLIGISTSSTSKINLVTDPEPSIHSDSDGNKIVFRFDKKPTAKFDICTERHLQDPTAQSKIGVEENLQPSQRDESEEKTSSKTSSHRDADGTDITQCKTIVIEQELTSYDDDHDDNPPVAITNDLLNLSKKLKRKHMTSLDDAEARTDRVHKFDRVSPISQVYKTDSHIEFIRTRLYPIVDVIAPVSICEVIHQHDLQSVSLKFGSRAPTVVSEVYCPREHNTISSVIPAEICSKFEGMVQQEKPPALITAPETGQAKEENILLFYGNAKSKAAKPKIEIRLTWRSPQQKVQTTFIGKATETETSIPDSRHSTPDIHPEAQNGDIRGTKRSADTGSICENAWRVKKIKTTGDDADAPCVTTVGMPSDNTDYNKVPLLSAVTDSTAPDVSPLESTATEMDVKTSHSNTPDTTSSTTDGIAVGDIPLPQTESSTSIQSVRGVDVTPCTSMISWATDPSSGVPYVSMGFRPAVYKRCVILPPIAGDEPPPPGCEPDHQVSPGTNRRVLLATPELCDVEEYAAVAQQFTELPAPQFTELPAPQFTELPAPQFTELPAPQFTDLPAPQFTDLPAPQFTELPAPQFTELPASWTHRDNSWYQ